MNSFVMDSRRLITFFTLAIMSFASFNSFADMLSGGISNKIKFFTDIIPPLVKPNEYAVPDSNLKDKKHGAYEVLFGSEKISFWRSIQPVKKPMKRMANRSSKSSPSLVRPDSYKAMQGSERILYLNRLKPTKKPSQNTFYRSLPEKKLHFYNTHTGESLNIVFWRGGSYVEENLRKLNRLFRDHRSGDVKNMDPRLFSLVYELNRRVGGKGRIEIISGHRSAATNARMRAQGRNVAKKSQHITGKAMDIRIQGVPLRKLRDTAIAMGAGGVGYYPSSNFVHIDTGDVRSW